MAKMLKSFFKKVDGERVAEFVKSSFESLPLSGPDF